MWGKILLGNFVILICSGLVLSQELLDLGHDLGPDSAMFPVPNVNPFKLTVVSEGFASDGLWYSSYNFCGSEHLSTHIDAPFHFDENGWKVDQIPIQNLFVPAAVIDVSEKVKTNSIYEVTAEDIWEWVNTDGPFLNNSVILVKTGWSKRYNDKLSYFGHEKNMTKLVFPGIHLSAAKALLAYRETSGIYMVGLGIDTPSIDFGPANTFPTHREIMKHNIYALENLNLDILDKISTRRFDLTVMPMKIRGGSGGPCRVIARVTNDGSMKTKNNYGLIVTLLSFLSIKWLF